MKNSEGDGIFNSLLNVEVSVDGKLANVTSIYKDRKMDLGNYNSASLKLVPGKVIE